MQKFHRKSRALTTKLQRKFLAEIPTWIIYYPHPYDVSVKNAWLGNWKWLLIPYLAHYEILPFEIYNNFMTVNKTIETQSIRLVSPVLFTSLCT